jgi:hypothetical protein
VCSLLEYLGDGDPEEKEAITALLFDILTELATSRKSVILVW